MHIKRAWYVTAFLGALFAFALTRVDWSINEGSHRVWPLALLFIFFLTERYELNLSLGKQSQALSLREVPLVIGLVMASPLALLIGAGLGSPLGWSSRGNPLVKTAFNTVLVGLEVALALVLYQGMHVDLADGPSAWLSLVVIILCTNIVSSVAIASVIGAVEGEIRWKRQLFDGATSIIEALANTALALNIALVMREDPRTAILLIVPALVLLLAYRTIIMQRQTQNELLETREQMQAILDNADALISLRDLDGRFLLVNKAYERLIGIDGQRLIERTLDEVFPSHRAAEYRQRDQMVVAAGESQAAEELVETPDGPLTYVSVNFPMRDRAGQIYATCDISTDITRLKQMESQVSHAQRMDAIGQLAGGVAHDFNNLLAVIQNFAAFVSDEVTEPHVKADVEEILKAADAGANLTRQLLTFSRREVVQPRPLDVDEVITDLLKILMRTLREDITLSTTLDSRKARVLADRGQLEQVLMNLVLNARDALRSGGTIAISTRVATPDDNGAGGPPSFILQVVDDGEGISEKDLERVMEPFFTTKPQGEGTGLGLATVYGIVTATGGSLDIESELGVGTTVTVQLPLTEHEEPVDEVTAPHLQARSGLNLLLAEDEDGVRALVTRILREAGHEVTACAHGGEALEALARSETPFDLLVTDMVMPGMDGRELAQRSGLPALFMSGYAEAFVADNGEERHPLVQKPFERHELLSAIEAAL
jgi:PAS domain S-box-containing protein